MIIVCIDPNSFKTLLRIKYLTNTLQGSFLKELLNQGYQMSGLKGPILSILVFLLSNVVKSLWRLEVIFTVKPEMLYDILYLAFH